MKQTCLQDRKNSGICTRQRPWVSLHRYREVCFLIVLLVFGLHVMSFAASDSKQSAQKAVCKPEDFPAQWPETRRIMKSGLPVRTRINMIIEILDKESVETSLARLDEHKMYTWGSTWIQHDKATLAEIPLQPGLGRSDLIAIMSNRRVLKLMEHLSTLRKAKAAALVEKEIDRALCEYNRLWDQQMEYSKYLKRKPYRDPEKPTRDLYLRRADGKPTLVAVRYKVLALLLLAGNLELRGTQPAVREVLEVAVRQRDLFYHNSIYDKRACAPMLVWASLYHRQILGTAVLGTYVDSAKRQEILKQFGCKLKTERLQRYTATIIPYGRLWEGHGVSRSKYTNGPLTVKYLEPLGDAKFDAIVNAAAEAREKDEGMAEEGP